jgi:TRAP-type mannitol/chloroaromatic compound transport system permease large subunit
MPYRIMSVMQNTILMAVPLFIFMGIVLQKTKLAEQLLEAMGDLFALVAFKNRGCLWIKITNHQDINNIATYQHH